MNKKYIAIVLVVIAAAEGGYYLYKNQSRSDRRAVIIGIASPAEDPSLAQGIKEGVELAVAGVNATRQFSVRFELGNENPLAFIAVDNNNMVLRVGGVDTVIIPRGEKSSAVIINKIKSVYGHDPLPFTAEAFDATKLIAAGVSRIPVGKTVDAATLRAVFKGLRGYTGESGIMQFDAQGVGHRQ